MGDAGDRPATVAEMTAQRRETYRPDGKRYDVFAEDGRKLGNFARKQAAIEMVDKQSRLQPHDERNKPIGSPHPPGVVVKEARTGEVVHEFGKRGKRKGG